MTESEAIAFAAQSYPHIKWDAATQLKNTTNAKGTRPAWIVWSSQHTDHICATDGLHANLAQVIERK